MKIVNIVVLVSVLFLLSGCVSPLGQQAIPKADKGQMDLREWDFSKGGPIQLEGEWEFYGNVLLRPEDFRREGDLTQKAYIQVPGLWSDKEQGKNDIEDSRYGTYRLRLQLKEPLVDPAIKIMAISTAANIYINGNLVVRIGQVGDAPERYKPKIQPQVVPYDYDGTELDIIIQVSNYTGLKGGIWDPIYLGSFKDIQTLYSGSIAIDYFLFGSVFIIGLYHIVLFLYWRKDQTPLYFGLACISVAAYSLMTGEIILTSAFPNMPFEVFAKAHVVTGIVAAMLFTIYFGQLFHKETSKLVLRLIQGICSAFLLLTLFTTFEVYSHLVKYEPFMFVFAGSYVLYSIVKALKNGNREARHVAIGFAVFFLCVLNDSSKLIGWGVSTGYTLTVYGLFFFVLGQANLLSKRLFNAYRSIEVLSHQLENKNLELVRLDRVKDDFLSNISHELRTPVHGMIGLAESVIRNTKELSKEVRNSLSLIVFSGKRLSRLISDILDFAKIQNSDLKLNLKANDIKQIVDVVIKLLKPLAELKSLTIINSIPQAAPAVIGDEDRLFQIFHNLIGNAIKFTERGEIEISSVMMESHLLISVKDTGIGIPASQQQAIFESFRQAEQSNTRSYEGTGLGLSITKELVNLHGGVIDVTSNPGEGSVFRFSLPIAAMNLDSSNHNQQKKLSSILRSQAPDLAEPISIQTNDGFLGSQNKGVILVVDDDPVSQKIVTAYLAPHRYEIVAAPNAQEALELLAEKKPDLVLLDIMMPGMSGFELCKLIREQANPSELPIIFLTAKQQIEELENAFHLGGNDYLTKPFSAGELISRIQNQLKAVNASQKLESLRLVAEKLSHQKDSEKIMSIVFEEISEQLDLDGACLLKDKKIIKSTRLDPSIIKEFSKQEKKYRPYLKKIENELTFFHGLKQPDGLIKLLSNLTNQPMKGSHWAFLQIAGFDEFIICLHKKNISSGFSQTEIEYIKNLKRELKAVLAGLREQSLELQSNVKYVEVAKDLNRTVYIKGGGGGPYVTVAFDSEEIETQTHRISLQNLQTYFSEEVLLRIHHSYLINPGLVDKNSNACVFKDKRSFKIKMIDHEKRLFELPVSSKYEKRLKQIHPEWFE